MPKQNNRPTQDLEPLVFTDQRGRGMLEQSFQPSRPTPYLVHAWEHHWGWYVSFSGPGEALIAEGIVDPCWLKLVGVSGTLTVDDGFGNTVHMKRRAQGVWNVDKRLYNEIADYVGSKSKFWLSAVAGIDSLLAAAFTRARAGRMP